MTSKMVLSAVAALVSVGFVASAPQSQASPGHGHGHGKHHVRMCKVDKVCRGFGKYKRCKIVRVCKHRHH